jgi:mono/diheme cytochrome c family protein
MEHGNTSERRRAVCAFALSIAILMPIAAATAAGDVGDPEAGHRLAAAWCSNCHAIEDGKIATSTGAPSFRSVAANHAMTPMALRAFLRTSHNRMPDLHLSNDQMDDLISYVLTRHR